MDLEDQISRMALALGIGLLMGLERGWHTREAAPGSRTAGIRTFSISSLLGSALGTIARTPGTALSMPGALLLAVGFATYAAVMAAFCYTENRADETFSVTTPIAAMLSFVLGAYAMIGNMWVAAASGVAARAILAAREELHGWVAQITWPELRSGLVLLAMTCIALPVMPTEPVGPYGGVNPREVWIIAIVLASVSFLAYVAVNYFGAQGVLLAGALGGLVSSTAVTIDSARRAAAREGPPALLTASVAIVAPRSLAIPLHWRRMSNRPRQLVAGQCANLSWQASRSDPELLVEQSPLPDDARRSLLCATIANVLTAMLTRTSPVSSRCEIRDFKSPVGARSVVTGLISRQRGRTDPTQAGCVGYKLLSRQATSLNRPGASATRNL